MAEKIQNLALNQKIVNEDGTPTMYFLRLLQDRGIISQGAATDADNALTIAQAAQADVDALELRNINTGAGLAGGGNLTADRTLTLNAGIDLLTDVDTSTTPPTNGQGLIWDTASSLWKPGTVSGGGGGGGSSVMQGVKAYQNGTLNVANSTVTLVTFNTEEFDTASFHSTSSNTSRFTAPYTGKYLVSYHVPWDSTTGNERIAWLRLNSAGAVPGSDTNNIIGTTTKVTPGASSTSNVLTIALNLNAGDYIELFVYQSSGGTRTISNATGGTSNGSVAFLSMLYLDAISGGGGGRTLISDTITGAAAADFTFSSIPGTYTDLEIVAELRTTDLAAQQVQMQMNGDTGANYEQHVWNRFGNASNAAATATRIGSAAKAGTTANVYAMNRCFLFNYASTTRFKNYEGFGFYPSDNFRDLNNGTWRSTAAITSLRLFPGAGNFPAGCRFRLYGLA